MSTPERVGYCTRETVAATMDQADTVRLDKRIDDAIVAGARDLEGLCHRRFYPVTGTRYLDPLWVSGDTMWVNTQDYEILSLSSLTVDGTALVANVDYYLEWPGGVGPPYTAIRRIRESSTAWSTLQRGNVAVGTFGGSAATDTAGALGVAISSVGATSMTVTDASLIGVGDLLLIDTEQVIVTEKASASTTATLTGNLTADESVTTVPVSSGALVHKGETILVGSERMFVEDVAGNNLVVQRALQGSVLAAHSTSDVVYAPRLCTITRGAAGTTAATHLISATLGRNRPPGLVAELNTAYALNYLVQGKSGYGRDTGSGSGRAETGTGGVAAALAALEDACLSAFGRQGRIGVC
jgi:hypothetical protein